ncbi:hypothetical protein H1P_220015 [Hyella patelloides LEGE 07179]|uniref:Uncharacterized protein n=1 Tax=Hyella patelloides LEGE 07179 TaxID=945734 RepID=A0A563VQV0_9CYAN|nr:hypothetical protein H1P_220015 [Hyella patelloides LEGE 07179]
MCQYFIRAELAELVDALDSDSSVRLEHSGSSPEFRTQQVSVNLRLCCPSIASDKSNINQHQKSSDQAGS